MTFKCRLCHSLNTAPAFVSQNYHGRHYQGNDQFQLFFCSNCHVYFLPPIEKQKYYFQNYYPSDYYPQTTFLGKILQPISLFPKHLLIMSYFNNRPISILDVGCGNGEFLRSLPSSYHKYGIDIGGITPTDNSYNYISGDISSAKIDHLKFDCITLWHVLEHLSDPKQILVKLRRRLNPKGFLLISVPNSSSLGFKLGHQFYFHLDSPRHLFIPNRKNLTFLLKETGFKNIKLYNPFYDYPLDLFWSVRHHPLRYLIYLFYPIVKLLSSETILLSATK